MRSCKGAKGCFLKAGQSFSNRKVGFKTSVEFCCGYQDSVRYPSGQNHRKSSLWKCIFDNILCAELTKTHSSRPASNGSNSKGVHRNSHQCVNACWL